MAWVETQSLSFTARHDEVDAAAAGDLLNDLEEFRAEERHANHRGTIQGGLLSSFADFVLGRAIEADADDDKDRATVSLTVDFLKPAQPGDWVESRSRVERVGGTLAFADCSLTVEGREIVRARAVFAVAG